MMCPMCCRATAKLLWYGLLNMHLCGPCVEAARHTATSLPANSALFTIQWAERVARNLELDRLEAMWALASKEGR